MYYFSIRERLLATLVAGIGCGWWVDHRNHAPLRAENDTLRESNSDFIELLQKEGYSIQRVRNLPKGGEAIVVTFPNGGSSASRWPTAIFNSQTERDLPAVDFADYKP